MASAPETSRIRGSRRQRTILTMSRRPPFALRRSCSSRANIRLAHSPCRHRQPGENLRRSRCQGPSRRAGSFGSLQNAAPCGPWCRRSVEATAWRNFRPVRRRHAPAVGLHPARERGDDFRRVRHRDGARRLKSLPLPVQQCATYFANSCDADEITSRHGRESGL